MGAYCWSIVVFLMSIFILLVVCLTGVVEVGVVGVVGVGRFIGV